MVKETTALSKVSNIFEKALGRARTKRPDRRLSVGQMATRFFSQKVQFGKFKTQDWLFLLVVLVWVIAPDLIPGPIDDAILSWVYYRYEKYVGNIKPGKG